MKKIQLKELLYLLQSVYKLPKSFADFAVIIVGRIITFI